MLVTPKAVRIWRDKKLLGMSLNILLSRLKLVTESVPCTIIKSCKCSQCLGPKCGYLGSWLLLEVHFSFRPKLGEALPDMAFRTLAETLPLAFFLPSKVSSLYTSALAA